LLKIHFFPVLIFDDLDYNAIAAFLFSRLLKQIANSILNY